MSPADTIILPGGVIINGSLRNDAVFHHITGYIEQALFDITVANISVLQKISAILMLVLDNIGSKKPDLEIINSLSIADRQYLMMQLSMLIKGDVIWMHLQCSECSTYFDVEVDRRKLPVVYAGGSYPYASLDLHDHTVTLKVPTGEVLSKLASCSENEVMDKLLEFCITQVDEIKPDKDFFRQLQEKDIEAIESTLEAVSPFICSEISTVCPECDCDQTIALDAHLLNLSSVENLYKDIHALASHYHWNEEEILALPRERRQLYLKYIDAGRGMYR